MRQDSIKHKEFALRIDEITTQTSEKLLIWLGVQKPLCDRIIAVRETTTKNHHHLYFQYKQPIIMASLRKRVERFFIHRGGQKALSLVKKPEQYITYILKENKLYYLIGFAQEEIMDYKARSYKKSVKPLTIPQQIKQIINKKYPLDTILKGTNGAIIIDIEKVIEQEVFNYYLERDKPMVFSYMSGVVTLLTAQYKSCYDSVLEDFRSYRLR